MMKILLVTDVFGITPALNILADTLQVDEIIDPYAGRNRAFEDEAQAYLAFSTEVGFDDYFTLLQHRVLAYTQPVIIIGFSVGASAIWRLSGSSQTGVIQRGICFYGSQIRNYSEIIPQFPVELIFPQYETHFDVCALQQKLLKKSQVKSKKIDYLHGFMNHYSTNYHQQAYDEQLSWLCSTIR